MKALPNNIHQSYIERKKNENKKKEMNKPFLETRWNESIRR
jgi:hypothetical protein